MREATDERMVFFVEDTQKSLAFYVEKLGFTEDWTHVENDEMLVAQVNRDGFEIILNKDVNKAGKGKVFISLDDEQVDPLRKEIKEKGLMTTARSWGMPVTEILDLDKNELLFSPPVSEADHS